MSLALMIAVAGCSSASDTAPTANSSTGSSLDVPTSDVATSTALPGSLADLVDRDWLVTASTGTQRNAADFPAHLRFSYVGDGVGAVHLTGCDVGTFPVVFEPSNGLSVGQPTKLQTCENPYDIGQAIPNILQLPLRWSIKGGQLFLTPTAPSDYSLVLS